MYYLQHINQTHIHAFYNLIYMHSRFVSFYYKIDKVKQDYQNGMYHHQQDLVVVEVDLVTEVVVVQHH